MTQLRTKKTKKDTIVVGNGLPGVAIPPPPPSQKPIMAALKAREWLVQPDSELGVHPSVQTTVKSLHDEIADCQRCIQFNTQMVQRLSGEIVGHYKQPYDRSRPITYNDDCSIMLIPQFQKLKETEIEPPKA
jgi:hypothetical protein